MNPDLVRYVISYYYDLMIVQEKQAYFHLVTI
jgi:hypothetical protein